MRNFLMRKLKSFHKNNLGNVAMIVAAATPVVVFGTGTAVDMARFLEARQSASSALDSASLALASEISRGNFENREEAEALAEEFFKNNAAQISLAGSDLEDNLPTNEQDDDDDDDDHSSSSNNNSKSSYGSNQYSSNDTGPAPDITTRVTDFTFEYNNDNASVTTTARLEMPTIFMSLFGYESLTTDISSTAAFRGAPDAREKIEFAFVLDVTGSMEGSRIANLKAAMRDSLNILLPEDGSTSDRVRVGLVPYSTAVNLGSLYQQAVGKEPLKRTRRDGSKYETRCVTEREGVNALLDVRPQSGQDNTYYNDPREYNNRGAYFVSCPTTEIRPLTNDRNALLADINGLTTGGGTAGHVGINWGFNLLSGEWHSFWPSGSKPAPYTAPSDDPKAINIRKILVVMTDGNFNRSYYNNIDHLRDAVNAGEAQNGNASEVAGEVFCNLAKEEDHYIEVYTIAFQTSDNVANRLRRCATPDDPNATDPSARGPHFFDVSSGEQLQAVFRAIAAQELKILLTN